MESDLFKRSYSVYLHTYQVSNLFKDSDQIREVLHETMLLENLWETIGSEFKKQHYYYDLRLKNKELENQVLKSQVDNKNEIINSYQESTSWRVTKPLRTLSLWFKNKNKTRK